MYESHFGLHRQPFQCADMMRAFFVSQSIRTIGPQLLHALRSDLGLAVLTGPVGVGKTTFLRHLQATLLAEGRTLLCSAASLETPLHVLQVLHTALNVRSAQRATMEGAGREITQSRWTLLNQLQRSSELWGPILLLIDDAQLLSVPVLNELRAFSEEEWNGRSLVRCLIAGPLTLEEELARPTHAGFGHRIRCHTFLQPLTIRESLELLERQLEAVGGQLQRVFTSSALELIASACDGLPRCLILLADETLVIAAERNLSSANEECVRFALSRLQHLPYPWSASPLTVDQQSLAPETSSLRSNRLAAQNGTDPNIKRTSPGVIEIGTGPASTSSGFFEIGDASNPSGLPTAEPLNELAEPYCLEVGSRFHQDLLTDTDAEIELKRTFLEQSDIESFLDDEAEDAGLKMNSGYAISWRNLEDSFSVTEFVDTEAKDALSALSYTPEKLLTFVSDAAEADPLSTGIEGSSSSSMVSTTVETCSDVDDRRATEQTSSNFSQRLPVFDRYTWVNLGREVPSGSHSVRSSSLSSRAAFEDSLLQSTRRELADVRPFDHIPTHEVSADQIDRHLFTSASEAGLKSVAANGSLDDFYETSSSAVELIGGLANTTPVVGVEFFNPPESSGIQDSTDSNGSIEPVHSVENRRAIRDAILERLSQVDGLKSTHDLEVLVDSAISTFDIEEISTRDESRWVDGHLVFGSRASAQSDDETDANSWSQKNALNSESDVVAKNDGAQSIELPNRGTFFTLDPDVSAITWDLRSEVMGTDEFLPIAQSLSELQNEVSSFQESLQRQDCDRWNEFPDYQSDPSSGSESLIVQARQRVEDLPLLFTTDASERPESEVGPAELAEGRWGGDAESSATSPSPDAKRPTSFGQLFTRLRNMKRASEEC